MERRRLTAEEQLGCIRDVKLGMSRSNAMKKWGIRHHSTLSQIIQRRGHQVKIVRPAGTQLIGPNGHISLHNHMQVNSATAKQTTAATVLSRARADARQRIVVRQPVPNLTQTETAVMTGSNGSGSGGFGSKLCFKLSIPHASHRSPALSMEQKIDEALSRLSKLNQKLIVRQGAKVWCKCCARVVNIKSNTVVARVQEHQMTRSHNENISRTRHERLGDPVNGTSDSDKSLESQPSTTSAAAPLPAYRFTRRKRQPLRPVRGQSGPSAVIASVPTAEQIACRQTEFQRDVLQTFLETGVPIHKLNMDPMRAFIQKWTGMQVPRYEEKSHEYGF